MALKTAQQIADKYQRGVSAAGPDYTAGVQNPSRPWAQATINGARRWETGIQGAIQNKSFAAGVQRAGDQAWQQGALNKGAQRYTAAATDASTKYAGRADQIMAAAATARAAIANMPTDTQEARIARSAAAQRATSQHWKGNKR